MGYSEPSRVSKMELLANLVHSWKFLTVSAKWSILDVLLGPEYVSASSLPEASYILLGKEVSQRKLGELRNEFFQRYSKTAEQTIILRSHYIILLNKRIK